MCTTLAEKAMSRLIAARRLMPGEGLSASSAAFEVGCESASQFIGEYARLFNAPPKRAVLQPRLKVSGLNVDSDEAGHIFRTEAG